MIMAMAMCAERHPTRQRYDELRRRYRKQLLRSVSPTKLLLSALSEIETFAEKSVGCYISYDHGRESRKDIIITIR